MSVNAAETAALRQRKTDPATLQPLRAEWEMVSRVGVKEESPKTETERHEYHFDWSGGKAKTAGESTQTQKKQANIGQRLRRAVVGAGAGK